MSNLNPDIREVDYGTRELKKLTVYPLSAGHQEKAVTVFQDVLTVFIQERANFKEMKDAEFIPVLVNMLKTSILEILKYVVEEDPAKIFEDITNNQLVELGLIIYEVNYKVPFTKLNGVIPKAEPLVPKKTTVPKKKKKKTSKK